MAAGVMGLACRVLGNNHSLGVGSCGLRSFRFSRVGCGRILAASASASTSSASAGSGTSCSRSVLAFSGGMRQIRAVDVGTLSENGFPASLASHEQPP